MQLTGDPYDALRERAWDYAIIAGHGGSGTKRLLRLLDQSPLTHCRNEPDRIESSPLSRLKGDEQRYGWARTNASEQRLAEGWDQAVAWARQRVGTYDFMVTSRKAHIHPLADALELRRLTASSRARRQLGRVLAELRGEEWRLPVWLGSRAAMHKAMLVMKLNQVPAFSPWILANRPRVRVLHIVRHPAGYFNSWWLRHVAEREPEQVRRANLARLRLIVERLPEWSACFGDFETASLARLELLFWLYANKLTSDAGHGREQYLRVLDEDVVADPLATARRVYESCGCPVPPRAERWLRTASGSWREGARPWRDLIDARFVELVEEILDRSGLAAWWAPDQAVSGIRYDLSGDLALWPRRA